MIIKGNKDERLHEAAHPERREMMKVARAVNDERRHPRAELAVKFFDQPPWRREAKARSPFARVHHRKVRGQTVPGIIEVEVQSSKSLCAQFAQRKRC